jgi:hypothetical protein
VYNCRTPNSWELDLALSATHYPRRGFTFAILYGSTSKIEKAVFERLQLISVEAAHPLLLPALLVELELQRHNKLVESNINDIEAKILEVKSHSSNAQGYCRSKVERRNESKRTAWLDLTYLRNSLMTWNTQLSKMAEHAEVLNRNGYPIPDEELMNISPPRKEETLYQKQMHRVGEKIKARVAAIRDEYDEKIRDCTMRVDGMAMATQWVNTLVPCSSLFSQQTNILRSKAKPQQKPRLTQVKTLKL